MNDIQIVSLFIHLVGSFIMAIALVECAVISRQLWLADRHRLYLPFGVPAGGTTLVIHAISFIFLTFLGVLSSTVDLSGFDAWPRAITFFIMIASGFLVLFHGLGHTYPRVSSKGVQK